MDNDCGMSFLGFDQPNMRRELHLGYGVSVQGPWDIDIDIHEGTCRIDHVSASHRLTDSIDRLGTFRFRDASGHENLLTGWIESTSNSRPRLPKRLIFERGSTE